MAPLVVGTGANIAPKNDPNMGRGPHQIAPIPQKRPQYETLPRAYCTHDFWHIGRGAQIISSKYSWHTC
jgi:hypothetical protein